MSRVGALHQRRKTEVRDASVTRWARCFSLVKSTHRVPIAATAAFAWARTEGWAWPARPSLKRWLSSLVQVFRQMGSYHRWVTFRTRRPTFFSRTPRRPKPYPPSLPSTLGMDSRGRVLSIPSAMTAWIMLLLWIMGAWAAGLSGKISTIRMPERRLLSPHQPKRRNESCKKVKRLSSTLGARMGK